MSMQIRFEVTEAPGLRDIAGRFTSEGRRAMVESNERLRLVVQSDVVARMRNHIAFGKRASASTGRLVQVTASGGNTKLLNGGYAFAVGIPSFLDKSVAKYWRTFEEGSAETWRHPFVGTQLIQFRKNPGRLPSAHGTDLRQARAGSAFRGFAGREGLYVVGREIAPAAIYRAAALQPNLIEANFQSAQRMLAAVFRRDIRPGGGYFG